MVGETLRQIRRQVDDFRTKGIMEGEERERDKGGGVGEGRGVGG